MDIIVTVKKDTRQIVMHYLVNLMKNRQICIFLTVLPHML
jgi:hypothetical protein